MTRIEIQTELNKALSSGDRGQTIAMVRRLQFFGAGVGTPRGLGDTGLTDEKLRTIAGCIRQPGKCNSLWWDIVEFLDAC